MINNRHNPRLSDEEIITEIDGFPILLDKSKELVPGSYKSMYSSIFKELIQARTAYSLWALETTQKVIVDARRDVLNHNPALDECDINCRFFRSEDWELFNGESTKYMDYEYKFTGRSAFTIRKVDMHYAVIFIGLLMGNIDNHLNLVEVFIGQKCGRSYQKALFPTVENAIFLVPDGIYSLEKRKFEVVFHTDFREPTKCTAQPLMVSVEPAGA